MSMTTTRITTVPIELSLGDAHDPVLIGGHLDLVDDAGGSGRKLLVLVDEVDGEEEVLSTYVPSHVPHGENIIVKDWSGHFGLSQALTATGLFEQVEARRRKGPGGAELTTYELRIMSSEVRS